MRSIGEVDDTLTLVAINIVPFMVGILAEL